MLGNGFASGGGGVRWDGMGGSSFDGARWGVKLSVDRTGLDCGCGMWGIVACVGDGNCRSVSVYRWVWGIQYRSMWGIQKYTAGVSMMHSPFDDTTTKPKKERETTRMMDMYMGWDAHERYVYEHGR